jgi:hypothetical protein
MVGKVPMSRLFRIGDLSTAAMEGKVHTSQRHPGDATRS